MNQDIEQLISDLSTAPRPRRRVRSPFALFMTWFLGSALYIALLVGLHFHPRADLGQKLMQPLVLAEFVTLILLAASTSLSATLLSYPDHYQTNRLVYAPIVVALLFVLVMFAEWLADNPPSPQPPYDMECCTIISVLAIPPALLMFARIRSMAPVHPRLAGACALLSSFSIGALTLRISEPTNSITHIIVWHYAPMIVVGVMGLAIGRKIFKW